MRDRLWRREGSCFQSSEKRQWCVAENFLRNHHNRPIFYQINLFRASFTGKQVHSEGADIFPSAFRTFPKIGHLPTEYHILSQPFLKRYLPLLGVFLERWKRLNKKIPSTTAATGRTMPNMTAMIITVGVLLPVCLPLPPAGGGVVGPWEEAIADIQRGGCYICRSTRRF